MSRLRPTALVVASALLTTGLAVGLPLACHGGFTQPPDHAPPSSGQSCDDPFEGQTVRFDTDPWRTDFCKHSVPYEEIRSGGPPPDGIPPIDDPEHVSVSEADSWLREREPVIAVTIDETARAYPLQILVWHEIVNDHLAGEPLAVTFCPLCYAALVFERPTVDGETLTFGTTGNLRNSDLVMWDRQTHSWWQQYTGEAIVGELTGRELQEVPASIVAWSQFREAHPDATVLSRDTGEPRSYGNNPYAGYDDVSKRPFMYDGEVEEGMPPMARVVAVRIDGRAKAYPLEALREQRVVNDRLGDRPIVVMWRAGTASALDKTSVARGRDIGATGVFDRRVDDRVLRFEAAGDDAGAFRDAQTGSRWNVLGEASGGELEGRSLEPIAHHDVFWFVWSAFQPDGKLYEDGE